MAKILEDLSQNGSATTSVAEEAAGENETKAEAFTRLAKPRVINAMDKIRVLANLATPNYEWTDEQAAKIIAALRHSVDELEAKFAKKKKKTEFDF